MRGINANRLSSMPRYMVTQLVEDKAMKEPRIIMDENKERGHLRWNIEFSRRLLGVLSPSLRE